MDYVCEIEVEDKKFVHQANDELLALQSDLVGCFNLKFIDRFAFDTRERIDTSGIINLRCQELQL